jgi:hypothetical protein
MTSSGLATAEFVLFESRLPCHLKLSQVVKKETNSGRLSKISGLAKRKAAAFAARLLRLAKKDFGSGRKPEIARRNCRARNTSAFVVSNRLM